MVLSIIGVIVGNFLEAGTKVSPEFIGGLILLFFLGLKILLEHLGILTFCSKHTIFHRSDYLALTKSLCFRNFICSFQSQLLDISI
ncbi:MAG: hypothetical protein ACLTTJ_14360 [Blautia sp.]